MAAHDWREHLLPKAANALEPFITALQAESGMTIECVAASAAIVATAIQQEQSNSLLEITARAVGAANTLSSSYEGLARSLMSIGISESLARETETRLEAQRFKPTTGAAKNR